jgi:hypothetical protein
MYSTQLLPFWYLPINMSAVVKQVLQNTGGKVTSSITLLTHKAIFLGYETSSTAVSSCPLLLSLDCTFLHVKVPCTCHSAPSVGEPYASRVELFSFHTVSKGALGECGLRGGYFEALNIHPDSIAQLYKLSSINLCPNVLGQIAVSLMVNEPKPGQPSYERFIEQKIGTLASYRCALFRQGTYRAGTCRLEETF